MTKFVWPAIFTTNYDRLIEDAYASSGSAPQTVQVIRTPDDPAEVWRGELVSLFKLHGCITTLQDPRAPLVLSSDDYRRTKPSRQLLLNRLKDLQRVHTWLFIGYSFADEIVVDLLAEMREAIGLARLRWSYAIMPNVDDFVRDYLREFKVLAIDLGMDEFFELLGKAKNQASTPTANLKAESGIPTAELLRQPWFNALDESFELLGLQEWEQGSSDLFFRGNKPTWKDLESNCDVERDVHESLQRTVQDSLASTPDEETTPTRAFLVTGSAGTGKTTLARRVAFDSYQSGARVLIVRAGASPDDRSLLSLQRFLQTPILVLVDANEVDYQALRGFFRRLVDHGAPVTLLITARTNEWTQSQRKYGRILVEQEYEISERLSQGEAGRLVDLLVDRSIISISGGTDRSYWVQRVHAADDVLLAFMLEVVANGRFREIVLSEFEGIDNDLGQHAYQIYLTDT